MEDILSLLSHSLLEPFLCKQIRIKSSAEPLAMTSLMKSVAYFHVGENTACSGTYNLSRNIPIYIYEKLAHFLSINALFNKHHQNINSQNSTARFKQQTVVKVKFPHSSSRAASSDFFNKQNRCLLLRFTLVVFKDI